MNDRRQRVTVGDLLENERKQRVTVGDLLDIRAGEMPSIVPPERRRQLLARIDASDLMVDESLCDSDRHAVDDVRLLSDDELVSSDDRDLAQPVEAETLDLSGPGIEDEHGGEG